MQADKDLMAAIMPFYPQHIGELFRLLDDLFQFYLFIYLQPHPALSAIADQNTENGLQKNQACCDDPV